MKEFTTDKNVTSGLVGASAELKSPASLLSGDAFEVTE